MIAFFALDTYRTQPVSQRVGKKTFSSRSLLLNLVGIVPLPSVGPGSGPNLLKKYQGQTCFPPGPTCGFSAHSTVYNSSGWAGLIAAAQTGSLWPSTVLQVFAQPAPPIIKGIASKNLRNHRYSGGKNSVGCKWVEKEKNDLTSWFNMSVLSIICFEWVAKIWSNRCRILISCDKLSMPFGWDQNVFILVCSPNIFIS